MLSQSHTLPSQEMICVGSIGHADCLHSETGLDARLTDAHNSHALGSKHLRRLTLPSWNFNLSGEANLLCSMYLAGDA